MSEPVRVRFAPSPTGNNLHVGGLRTALYNYLLAHKHGGNFLLRIEDTDQSRLVPEATERFISALNWAGVAPDEGAGCQPEGPFGPYIQSQRLSIYKEHAQQLLDQGLAYYCFATAEELEQMRQGHGGYDGRYRDFPPEQAREWIAQGRAHVVRMKVPPNQTVRFEDCIRGPIQFDTSTVDDQVLIKSDGFPTYHLAAVVDDHLMQITHVIRGEEWLSSTPKHLLLYQFFGWQPPQFAHLPLIVNLEGKKLSKRDGAVSVEAYIEQGFLAEALINFLALLGWSAGDDKEIYTKEELVAAFSLQRVSHSPSVFDQQKLRHINQQHLFKMTAEQIHCLLLPWFECLNITAPPRADLLRIIEVMKPRCSVLPDFISGALYFYQEPEKFDGAALKKRWKDETNDLILEFADELEKLAPAEWTAGHLDQSLRYFAEQKGISNGNIIHPTRVAVSGVAGGPGLFDLLELVGKDRCLARLRRSPQLAQQALSAESQESSK